jgi:radical SAM superfamily enzyme YgiQ (UPF0313 family)
MVKRILLCFYAAPVHYNHGTALLSRLCRDAGIEVDVAMPEDMVVFQSQIKSKRYDLIGFSCVIERDYMLCKPYIELALNYSTVALGGPFFRRNNPNEFGGRCLICRGEGELLPDFILRGDDTIFKTRYVHPDIKSLPLPYFGPPMVFDREIPGFAPRRMVPYYSSRGCFGKCNFCDVRHQTGIFRIRRRVKEDLAFLAEKHKPEMFFIGDETIPYHDADWRESWGDFKFPFFAYIRADIPEILLSWLIDRKMVACAFGVESGDEKYRNEVLGKNLMDKDVYRTAEILKKAGVHFVHFYMCGTKQETNELRYKTIQFMNGIGGGMPLLFNYRETIHDSRKEV